MEYELYFLNPSERFMRNIPKSITDKGYEKYRQGIEENEWIYKRERSIIYGYIRDDHIGPYVALFCNEIPGEEIEKSLSVCPECQGKEITVSVLHSWESAATKKLYAEGKLDYGTWAYDRIGTKPQTHTCRSCGCKWHNGAAFYRWITIINQGRLLKWEDVMIT